MDKRSTIEELKGLVIGRCIILGDFNIKKGSKLDVGKWLVFTWENSREMLKKMREECLGDIWRYENPGKRKFY